MYLIDVLGGEWCVNCLVVVIVIMEKRTVKEEWQ
jgi:hypothetical protein